MSRYDAWPIPILESLSHQGWHDGLCVRDILAWNLASASQQVEVYRKNRASVEIEYILYLVFVLASWRLWWTISGTSVAALLQCHVMMLIEAQPHRRLIHKGSRSMSRMCTESSLGCWSLCLISSFLFLTSHLSWGLAVALLLAHPSLLTPNSTRSFLLILWMWSMTRSTLSSRSWGKKLQGWWVGIKKLHLRSFAWSLDDLEGCAFSAMTGWLFTQTTNPLWIVFSAVTSDHPLLWLLLLLRHLVVWVRVVCHSLRQMWSHKMTHVGQLVNRFHLLQLIVDWAWAGLNQRPLMLWQPCNFSSPRPSIMWCGLGSWPKPGTRWSCQRGPLPLALRFCWAWPAKL